MARRVPHGRGTKGDVIQGKLVLLAWALLASTAHAEYGTIQALASSVHDRVGVTNGRLQETADQVTVRAKRATRLMGSAEALYSDVYNLLLLEPNLFDAAGHVKSFDTLAAERSNAGEAALVVDTVYHELGHAEWDVCIEERKDAVDKAFYAVAKDQVVPWIQRTQTKVRKPWLCVMEWHGYYWGSLMNKLLSDWNDLLFWNGIDPKTLTIGPNNVGIVRSNLEKGLVDPADFGKLLPQVVSGGFPARLNTPYGTQNRRYSIEVMNGRFRDNVCIEMSEWNAANGFQDAWWDAIWNHVYAHAHPPATPAALMERMNGRYAKVLGELAALQRDLWDKGHRPAGGAALPVNLLGQGR